MPSAVINARLADELPVAVLVLDAAGAPIYANRRFEALLGDGEAEDVVRRLFADVARTARPQSEEHVEVTAPDGRRRYLRAEARPLLDEDGTLTQVALAFADVSDERLVREQTATVVEELRFVLEHMSDFVYRHDAEGNFFYMSPAVETITGYTVEEWMNHYTTYMTDSPQNERVVELTEAALRTGVKQPTYTVELWHAHGQRVALEVNERPFFNDAGAVAGIVGVARDVTERARATAEIRRLNRTLSDKNRDLERVIYVASHDLRTPLVGIEGFATELGDMLIELRGLLADTDLPARARELLEDEMPAAADHVQRGAHRMDRLLGGLLKLSRVGRLEMGDEPVDVGEVATRLADSFAFPLRESGAQLEIDDLPPCRGDAFHVEQLLSNLLGNALKFLVPDRPGRIVVSGERDGVRVRYRIADNGRGIAPRSQERIFDVFHRVDPAGPPGDGIGLSVAQRIAERLGGSIGVESDGHSGTTIIVELEAP